MPSIYYMNQSAPFWDWVASLESREQNIPAGILNSPPPFGPWGFQPRRNHHRRPEGWPWGYGYRNAENQAQANNNQGQAAQQQQEQAADPPTPNTPPSPYVEDAPEENEKAEAGPSTAPQAQQQQPQEQPQHRGHPCGRGRRGHCGPRRDVHPGQHPFNDFRDVANFFQDALFGATNGNNTRNTESNETNESAVAPTAAADKDYSPPVDVFDTSSSYVLHFSLPGAKKEDVGVNWDAEKSELTVAGVIYRPGDEELLKALALDERRVGAFERKVRLGSRVHPAHVDVEGITAKLEDGVLRVEVPKLQEDEFVEIKKVEVE